MSRMPSVLSMVVLVGGASCALGEEPGAEIERLRLPTPGAVERVAELDPALGQLPENIAVDRNNRIAVSFIHLGAVHAVTPDGNHAPIAVLAPGLLTTGVVSGPNGWLYVLSASPTGDPAANAVWEIDPAGQASLYAALPGSALPNDLAFDWNGNLYVTDSILGAIWKIAADRIPRVWVADPLLAGVVPPLAYPGHPPFPIGANGIVVTPRTVYVANTDRNAIVRVPRGLDGSAGTPELVAQGPEPGDLAGCSASPELVCVPDGLALDVLHNVYVAGVGSSTVIRVRPNGSSELIAGPEDGLDSTSDCSFGRGAQAAQLHCSNYAVVNASIPGAQARPSVTRQDIGIAGFPQP